MVEFCLSLPESNFIVLEGFIIHTDEDSVIGEKGYLQCNRPNFRGVGGALIVMPRPLSFRSICSISSLIKICIKERFEASGLDLASILIFFALIFAIFVSKW